MSAVFYLRRVHIGAGGETTTATVRVRAQSLRGAFERVRKQRPAYADDRLICVHIQEERPQ